MEHKGKAILSIGEGVGDEAAVDAVKDAIESPLLDNLTINGAMGVLIHFTINPNFPLTQIQSAMDIIYDSAHEDADIIFGTTTNENLAENEVKITLVATGFESGQTTKSETPVNTTEKTNLEPKPEYTQQELSPNDLINQIRAKLMGNRNYTIENVNDLDIPAFMR
jgi:cell division protein FtsZ